jgi:hypothetical protein
VKPARLNPGIDCASPQAGLYQLFPRHHAVLASRECADPPFAFRAVLPV